MLCKMMKISDEFRGKQFKVTVEFNFNRKFISIQFLMFSSQTKQSCWLYEKFSVLYISVQANLWNVRSTILLNINSNTIRKTTFTWNLIKKRKFPKMQEILRINRFNVIYHSVPGRLLCNKRIQCAVC